MAAATLVYELDSARRIPAEQATLIAELKAGSEEAYARLIAQYHQPIYSLVYRVVCDPAEALDTTQEVFLKIYRGMKHFNGASSLKTWIYRVALYEALNQRRWWSRHKAREVSMEPMEPDGSVALKDSFVDHSASPFENVMQQELRTRVETELHNLQEPYRTTVILRDLEGFSYEEISEITSTSPGTVRSRLARGRQALRKRFAPFLQPSRCLPGTCEMSCTCGD